MLKPSATIYFDQKVCIPITIAQTHPSDWATLVVTRPKEAFMGGHPSQEIRRECYVKSKQARMFALCAQIAAEYDRDTFTQLIYELNDLLEGKAQILDGTETRPSMGSN